MFDSANLSGMGIFRSKTPEEKAAEREQREHDAWLRTPPGQARLAYERGDTVLQVAVSLTSLTILRDGTDKDPSRLLSEVCAEGWELVSGTAVFVPRQQTDSFVFDGHKMEFTGTTVGYYLFRRR